MALSAKDILNRKPDLHEIVLPNIGTVLCKPLSGAQVKKYQSVQDPLDLMPTATILGLCDKNGNPLFTADQFDEVFEAFTYDELQIITTKVLTVTGLINPKQ